MTAMSYEFEPACRRMEWLDPFYKSVWEKAYQDAIANGTGWEIKIDSYDPMNPTME